MARPENNQFSLKTTLKFFRLIFGFILVCVFTVFNYRIFFVLKNIVLFIEQRYVEKIVKMITRYMHFFLVFAFYYTLFGFFSILFQIFDRESKNGWQAAAPNTTNKDMGYQS